MAPSLIWNHGSRSRKSPELKETPNRRAEMEGPCRWRTRSQQRIYSAKLYQAICRVRTRRGNPQPGSRAVKEAADRVLAVAARGKTRWSRSILGRRPGARFRGKHRNAAVRFGVGGGGRVSGTGGAERAAWPSENDETRRVPGPLKRRLRVFRRLIPGCRNLPMSKLVGEAADYIAALEMQVRAMAELAELLAGAGAGAGAPPHSPDRFTSPS